MDVACILESSTAKSLGLVGMKERAERTGGKFQVEAAPGEGSTVRAVWPIRQDPPLAHAGEFIH